MTIRIPGPSTLVTAALAAVLSACGTPSASSTGSPPVTASQPAAGPALIYAAVGASETVGTGSEQGVRQAWPQLVYNDVLPRSALYYNFGIPGATTAEAVQTELPQALAVHPTLVTVWLNVNDLLAGVTPQSYEGQLRSLVHALRQRGAARVLIANTPALDRLPAVRACLSGTLPATSPCPTGVATPTIDQLNAQVDRYNAAISRVAAGEGAVLVDLHAQGEVADSHPDWVSADGFHPSELGYAAIAGAFEAVLRKGTPA